MEFEWHDGNRRKNAKKHGLTTSEIEQSFFNFQILHFDNAHGGKKIRFYMLSITDADKYLFVAFTIRGNKIRVISARLANAKERTVYEKFKKNS